MPTLLLFIALALAASPADDELGAWHVWDRLDELCEEGRFDEALVAARDAASRFSEDAIDAEQAAAWSAWLAAVTALPDDERAAVHDVCAVFARAPRQLSVREETSERRQQLQAWQQLVDVPHPRRPWLLLLNAMSDRGRGDLASAHEGVTLALTDARERWQGDHPEIAKMFVEQAAQRRLAGDDQGAWQLATEAHDMLTRLDRMNGSAWIMVRNQQAILADTLDLPIDRLGIYAELVAATESEQSEEHASHLSLLGNWANVLREQGRYPEAIAAYERLLETQRRTGDTVPFPPHVLSGLAQTHLERGSMARADELLAEALQWLDAHPDVEPSGLRQLIYSRLGAVAIRDGRPADAIGWLERSIAELTRLRGPDNPSVFAQRLSLAHALSDSGARDRALSELLDLVEFADRVNQDPARCAALADIGRLLAQTRQGEQALSVLSQAAELARSTGNDRRLRVIEHDTGLTFLSLKRFAEAVKPLQHAADLLEDQRERIGDSYERATFGRAPYADLATAMLLSGDEAGAWRANELGRARATLDLMHRQDRRGQQRARPLLASPVTLVSTQAEVASALHDDEAMVGWLEGTWHRSWVWVLRADGSLRWHELGVLDELLGQDPTAVFARDRDILAQAAWSLFGAPDESEAQAVAERLERLWFAPVEADLAGVERLVVVPPDALAGLPPSVFGQFGEGGPGWLVDRFQLSHVASASLLTVLRDDLDGALERADETTHGLVLGDPPFRDEHLQAERQVAAVASPVDRGDDPREDEARRGLTRSPLASQVFRVGRLPRLPASRDEALAVAAHCDSALLLVGADASEQRLAHLADQDGLRDFDVLHFATHARADTRHVERSELVLCQVSLPNNMARALDGEQTIDGRLTAGEILNSWRLDADLVVLSACETAGGRTVVGEGAVGLAQAFLIAGARNVLATAWQVDDRATELFMDAFYGAWLDGRSSLRDALDVGRRSLRSHTDEYGEQPYDHPACWGAFVLIGAGE